PNSLMGHHPESALLAKLCRYRISSSVAPSVYTRVAQYGDNHAMSTALTPALTPAATPHDDFLPLRGTDHVEFYVGNARQAAYFYRAAFGMSLVAYAGPETGQRDRASYVVEQGKIRFVFTTALRSDSEIARHVAKHGDGVHAIALWVDDARKSWEETTKRGAHSIQ